MGDRYAELYSLSVLPGHRGKGVGTALLDEVDLRLAALGVHDLMVSVMVGDDGAVRLYEARGFAPAEIVFWSGGPRRDRA